MTGRRDIFDQAMRAGHSAAWDQQWDRAIVAYLKAIDEFPEDLGALTSLGQALFQVNRLEEALNAYQRAARLAPGEPLALEKSAEILERFGRVDRAAAQYLAAADIHLNRRDAVKTIENWERAARISPEDLATHSRLALAYERTGKPQPAAAEYLVVARLFQLRAEASNALQAVQRALQLDPQNPNASQALRQLRDGRPVAEPPRPRGGTGALRMAKVQEFVAPEASASASVGAEPEGDIVEQGQKRALTALAGMLFEDTQDDSPVVAPGLGALTRGLTGAMRQGRNDRTQVILHLGQAIDHHTQGRLAGAIGEYDRAIASGLEHPAALYNLGSLELEHGDPESALGHLRAAVNHPDYALAAHCALGRLHLRQGRPKQATLSFLQALRLADTQSVPAQAADELEQLYEAMADGVANAEESAESKTLAENLQRFLAGPDWKTRLGQARAQLDAQADGRPTPLAELIFVAGTDSVVQALARIDALLKRGLFSSAMEEAYMALEYAPTYLPVHQRIAEILLEENRLEAGIAKYAVVADTYRARGDTLRAARIMEEVVRLAPLNLDTRLRLIELLTEMDHTGQALSHYLDLASTCYQLADLDRARKTLVDGLRLAQRANADRAWSVQFLHQMGDIDLQRLEWRQALRVYEQIKTLAPDDDKARTTLVDLNLRLGQARQAMTELDDYLRHLLGNGMPDRAMAALEDLVRNRPAEMAFRARLARLYQESGRKADAIGQLDALGEMQLDAGMTADAANTVRAILDMGPEDPTGYRQLLARLGA